MEGVKRYLEKMFGRSLTENEAYMINLAYSMGQQNEFDKWAKSYNIIIIK
ncbi:hypothetical protein [Bacillus sp. UMB0728]|nr:hypothetical protein [Bacillus sp. UMB0728]